VIKISGTKWTIEEVEKLKELSKKYSKYKYIVPHFDRSKSSITNKMHNLGLTLLDNVDINFFNRKDEISYYILGYWFADGCIMYKSGGYYFSIVSNDIEHLKRIKKEMEIKTKIYENSNDAYEVRVGNKKLINNMIDNFKADYKKTKIATIPYDIIPEKHFYDFLRGYFDGDGSINLQKYTVKSGQEKQTLGSLRFTGAKNIIKSLYEKFPEATLTTDSRKNDCLYLNLFGDEMRNLLTKMYKDSKIYLKRKYKVYFNQIKNK